MYPEEFRHLYTRKIAYKGHVWRMIRKLQNLHMKKECFHEQDKKWASIQQMKTDNKITANHVDTMELQNRRKENRRNLMNIIQSSSETDKLTFFQNEGRSGESGEGLHIQRKNSTQRNQKCGTDYATKALSNGKITNTLDDAAGGPTNTKRRSLNQLKTASSIKIKEQFGCYNTYEEGPPVKAGETSTHKFENTVGGKTNIETKFPNQSKIDSSITALSKNSYRNSCKESTNVKVAETLPRMLEGGDKTDEAAKSLNHRKIGISVIIKDAFDPQNTTSYFQALDFTSKGPIIDIIVGNLV